MSEKKELEAGVPTVNSTDELEVVKSYTDVLMTEEVGYTDDEKIKSSEDVVRLIIDSEDEDLPVWTFRTWFLGIGLAIFGGVLQCIFYFKPQTIVVNGIFLMLIAYCLGELMAFAIPRKGWFKYLNPHPFNKKEHVAITIMASSAATCALAIEVLLVQKLWYNSKLNGGVSIFMIFSSQLMGYGLCGLVRKSLVYPTKMFFPNIVPQVTTIQSLHKDKLKTKDQLKWFYIIFVVFFLYEIIPEYIFQLLIAFSIPCLLAPRSRAVSRLFGGGNGNEGLGFLSICLDWNYVASTANPMAIPLVATMNNIAGYLLCISVFIGVYYGNVWKAKSFPFLSQDLFYGNSTGAEYWVYNQTAILDKNNHLSVTLLKEEGIPYMASTYVVYLIATNLSVGATFTHMYLYNKDEVLSSLAWLLPKNIKNSILNWKERAKFWVDNNFDSRLDMDGNVPKNCDDPHFRQMLKYKEVPQWWYLACLVISFGVGIGCSYAGHTNLEWWMMVIAVILAFIFTLALGGLVGLFGFGGTQMQTVIQLIGAYIRPGNPLANMYFTLYGYNSVQQAFLMLQDLKQAQYVKLPPRSTFTAQLVGTLVGAIFNYIMMQSIVDNKADILKSVEGTAIWSGQNVQQYNTQGIAWGALAKYIFSAGKRYQMVPFSLIIGFFLPLPFYVLHRLRPTWGIQYINVPILVWYIGWLCVGVNSSITSYFIVLIVSQYYIRRYYPALFKKYNYIISAAMTGGAQVMVFVLSFAVAGASGQSHPFPTWWGNYQNDAAGNPANIDHCKYLN